MDFDSRPMRSISFLAALLALLSVTELPAQDQWRRLSVPGDPYMYGVLCFSRDTLVVRLAASVVRSTDGGISWHAPTLPIEDTTGLMFTGLRRAGPSVCFLYGSQDLPGSPHWSTIMFRSSDAGATWERITSDTLGLITAVSFPTATLGYALGWLDNIGMPAFFARSTDGGTTWEFRDMDLGYSPGDIAFRDSLVGKITVGGGGGFTWVVSTLDAGRTWAGGGPSTSAFEVVPLDDGVWIASSCTGIFRASGDTAAWENVLPGFCTWGLGAYDNRIVYALAYGDATRLQKSTDGGLTWREQLTDLIGDQYELYDIDVADDSAAYAVGSFGAIITTAPGPSSAVGTSEVPSLDLRVVDDHVVMNIPATGEHRIARMVDALGRVVATAEVDRLATSLRLDVGAMPAGAYFVTFGRSRGRIMLRR